MNDLGKVIVVVITATIIWAIGMLGIMLSSTIMELIMVCAVLIFIAIYFANMIADNLYEEPMRLNFNNGENDDHYAAIDQELDRTIVNEHFVSGAIGFNDTESIAFENSDTTSIDSPDMTAFEGSDTTSFDSLYAIAFENSNATDSESSDTMTFGNLDTRYLDNSEMTDFRHDGRDSSFRPIDPSIKLMTISQNIFGHTIL
jgi:hypothetical protein